MTTEVTVDRYQAVMLELVTALSSSASETDQVRAARHAALDILSDHQAIEDGRLPSSLGGCHLIMAERQRQIDVEHWTASHDDQEHYEGELLRAAMAYLKVVHHPDRYVDSPPDNWPWDAKWWKPSDPIRDLVKAGALIAAEIDRLQRATP